MDRPKLEATYRTDLSKSHVKRIRKAGGVTGSVFGHNVDSIPIELKLRDVVDQIKASDAGMMSLIDLKITGAPKGSDGTVIIKGFHKDPLTRRVLDIQFQRVSLKEKINISVPIVLVGDAAGAREGGIVEQITNALDVSCLPTDIPPRIEVDISGLEIGHHISVSDLTLDENIEVKTDPSTNICTCVPPHVTHAAAEAVEAALAEGAAEAESGTKAAE
jgi:large subunit ribosomal protein L25